MTNDPPPTRLAETDPWEVIEVARRERAPLVAEGCRSAVAWLYQGAVPSSTSWDELPFSPTSVRPRFIARLVRWLRSVGSFNGSRPA